MAGTAQFQGDRQAAEAGANVVRRFWMAGLVLSLSCLSAFAIVASRGPMFEAQAVVHVRPGADMMTLIEGAILGRDALLATAARQGLGGTDTAVTLRQAVALNDLTSVAGATLGLAPQTAGLVISVRLPDVDQAVRVANDLALQVLDLGQTGQLDANHDELAFYQAEEERLWQEISALRAEVSQLALRTPGDDRKVMLLQDQYDVVRHGLAVDEVASRLAERTRAGQFALLQRATDGQAVQTGLWVKRISLAISLALTAALALTALGRVRAMWGHRSGAFAPAPVTGQSRLVLGLPRHLAISLTLVAALLVLAEVLR